MKICSIFSLSDLQTGINNNFLFFNFTLKDYSKAQLLNYKWVKGIINLKIINKGLNYKVILSIKLLLIKIKINIVFKAVIILEQIQIYMWVLKIKIFLNKLFWLKKWIIIHYYIKK